MATAPLPAHEPLLQRLAALEATLATDTQTLAFMAADMADPGTLPLAVLRPHSVDALAQAVALATAAGLSVFPRGGGMSYTSGFTPTRPAALLLDLSGLDRIIELNAQDLYVTVETGCTWAALDAALAPHGLRTPFWGPFSGFNASVGGSLSQGTATFGTARAGTSGDNVLALDVIAADGRLIRTGPAAQPGFSPFTRQYGPDLTGLFCNDCGALGIKARITLPLEPRPAHVAGLSFLFRDFASLATALRAVTASGLASEAFAMDPAVTRQFAGTSGGFSQDLASLLAIGRAQSGPLAAAARMAQVALAGRRFLGLEGYQLHVTTEADDRASLGLRQTQLRRLLDKDSVELPPTVPTMVRAVPFAPLPVLSPGGGRVYPLHGIVPWSRAAGLDAAMQAIIAAAAPEAEACNLTIGTSFFGVARAGLLYEPVLYWPDSRLASHEGRTTTDLPRHPENPAARALARRLTGQMLEAFHAAGAVHLQIGRLYPWARSRDEAAMALIRALKAEIDPHNRINPGVLGL